jgi:hypothetical protein
MFTQPLTHQSRLAQATLGQTTLHVIFTILSLSMTPQQQLHIHLDF